MSVPVLAVAGHLGAGKTTLLNHLLRNGSGVRIGALVNDFGAVNIDAMLIAGQVDAMAALSNGCICCVTDDGELAEMLGKLAAVKPRLDLIVVEASGVADPPAVARTILAVDDNRFHYAGLVLVVDADAPTGLEHGARVADLIVLNKVSAAEDLEAVRATVRAHNPVAPVVATDFAKVDPGLLIDPAPRPLRAQMSFDELLHDEHHDHEHPEYQSIDFRCDTALNPRLFMNLLRDRPQGLYRAKGFVDFGPAHRYLLHVVGGSVRFERTRRAGTELVFIGTEIDTDALRSALHECSRVPADEQGILGVLKFVV